MRLGVVLEAFLDRTLDDTLDFVARGAPQITDLEIGVGGFAPTPHCDVGQLLRDPTARRRWTERLENRGRAGHLTGGLAEAERLVQIVGHELDRAQVLRAEQVLAELRLPPAP